MNLNELTQKILGAAMKVHSALGPGLLESAYEKCLLYELHQCDLNVMTQIPLPIVYKSIKIDAAYRIDLLVENKVIVEVKCVNELLPIHKAQLLTYLKLSQISVGLLLNFHVTRLKEGILRVVNELNEEPLRPSAFSAVKSYEIIL
ncbi:MAG: GxxExxY protein [Verrucomicrobiae bacterium]|nr:GxxExxY protein [Verrucomicrobiae bacterium]